MTDVAVTCSEQALCEQANKLARDLSLSFADKIDETCTLYLELTPERLQLRSTEVDAPGPVYVDFVGGALGHRVQFGGGRRQILGRAVGIQPKQTLKVLDVTAGLGRDAFILAHLGCEVTMLESSPIVAALLKDGLKRAQPLRVCLAFKEINAVDYLKQLSVEAYPDVIYLDPMFPPLKKSAKVKKEMRVLKRVVGEDQDSKAILTLARQKVTKRVVVKRHRSLPGLTEYPPDLVFEGKTSRFDIYFPLTR